MRITSRIQILTTALVTFTALCIGLISFLGYRALIHQEQKQALRQIVTTESRRLMLALRELQHDVRLIAALPITTLVAEEVEQGIPVTQDSPLKHQLAEVFSEILRSKPHYDQLRLISVSDEGHEVVRVDRRDNDVVRVSGAGLQRKADRAYFREALHLQRGRLYISRINLNREHGVIERPYRPMLRVALRLDDLNGDPLGIVIINLRFAQFLDDLFSDIPSSQTLYLTNAAGDYLAHPDKAKTFGFDLGASHRMQDDYPGSASAFDTNARADSSISLEASPDDDRLLCVRRVAPFRDDPDHVIVLGIMASADDLTTEAIPILRRSAVATLMILAVAFVASVLATRMVARPINRITTAANHLANGAPVPSLPIDRSDEVGALSRAFEHMATAIERKESEILKVNAQLSAANEDLEHFVHIAAHDLREPLRKQRKLVDLLLPELREDDTNDAAFYAKQVSICSNQMQEMIDAFRELTRLEATNEVRSDVSLPTLIRECLAEVDDQIRSRAVQIRFDDFPATTPIYPELARRLYTNLIQNALYHVHASTFTLEFTAQESEAGWIFGVRNSGSSIPPDRCREVFSIFRKVGKSDPERTGLGLSICRKIVERHRGIIYVESTSDVVHFQFTFGGNAHEHQDHE
ncbi:MAG TPA: cache domain-containing protein [Phycisphaerae bacterium]|nr:cache domain-containing protein [Phycisphaerae bacterium]HRW53380.1 cache domain-containing protein [Phycisphaerae bacterium]